MKDAKSVETAVEAVVTQPFQTPNPDVLYHYTSWEGATGMLKSRRLWSSAHDCMNDPAELVTANAVIRSVAEEHRATYAAPAVQIALNVFLRHYANMQLSKQVPVFLTCFSMARDDENQWLQYGDGGRGLCLAIPTLNEGPPDNPGLGCSLLKVDYSPESWREHLSVAFTQICQVLDGADESVVEITAHGASGFFRVAAFEALRAKQPAWAIEQEYRLAAMVRDPADPKAAPVDVKTRLRNGQPVSYVEVLVRQPDLPIGLTEVIVGPEQNAASSFEAFEALLQELGYGDDGRARPTISRSGIAAAGTSAG